MTLPSAVDTNVLVRILTADDPEQTRKALAVLESGPVWIPKSVLLETVWVLRSGYGIAEPVLQDAIAGLLSVGGVEVESRGEVERALEWWRASIDIADALHLAASSGASRFVTFDRAFARRAKRPRLAPRVEAL